ncbi:hypothetical protein NGM37_49470, partial [Streptomyces sp. TRM76130]|nr:hypothetical protein [Streptomyces sp. TRM76130]
GGAAGRASPIDGQELQVMADAEKDLVVKPLDNHATGVGTGTTTLGDHATGGAPVALDDHATGGTVTPLDNHATGEQV